MVYRPMTDWDLRYSDFQTVRSDEPANAGRTAFNFPATVIVDVSNHCEFPNFLKFN